MNAVGVQSYPVREAGTAAGLDIPDLQGQDEVRAALDARYPTWYGDDAWVTRVGDSLFVMNSNENKDMAQTYSIPLDGAGNITQLSSTAIPHWYLIAKRLDRGNGLWVQATPTTKAPTPTGAPRA